MTGKEDKIPKLLRLVLDPAAPDGEVLAAALALRNCFNGGDRLGELRRQLVAEHEAGCLRFPFGKHQGQTLEEIIRVNPEYLLWCLENVRRLSPQLRRAIEIALRRTRSEW